MTSKATHLLFCFQGKISLPKFIGIYMYSFISVIHTSCYFLTLNNSDL